MLMTPDMLLLFLCLVAAVDALHKQWIPDTNYENKTNWDREAVPCGNDIAHFPAQRKVSVFVETTHAVREMRLPVDGEFILNSGAGFYVVRGKDPGCRAGVTTKFRDSESLRWFNPALWQAAATLEDLRRGNFLFTVHEESVPCLHDDVVFRAHSSFRMDTSSSQSSVPVKSVSVLGKRFESRSEFSQYLSSRSGQLQFRGSSVVTVGNTECGDPSGCDCGNSVHHQQICSAVTCDSLSCEKPLHPAGHCCGVCGAIVTIDFAAAFNLQTYRQRIHHLFLILPKYKNVRLGMSKVFMAERLMGVIPFGTSSEIQVVIVDGEKGLQCEDLARDILKDARSHGSNLGIAGAAFITSCGSSSDKTGGSAGMVVGVVFGVSVTVTIGMVVVLNLKGVVRVQLSLPSLPTLSSLMRRSSNVGDLGGSIDRGFDNPIFDRADMPPDIPGVYVAESHHSIAMTQTRVHFVNPVYEDNETDLNA